MHPSQLQLVFLGWSRIRCSPGGGPCLCEMEQLLLMESMMVMSQVTGLSHLYPNGSLLLSTVGKTQ